VSDVERVVMWLSLPIKIPMAIVILVLLPMLVAIDYGTSPNPEKRYSIYLIRGFNGLVRFLIT
jgi:hypothetical protein